MEYEAIEPLVDGGQSFIKRTNEDGTESFIPADQNNSDYQAYLKSLEPEIVEEPVVEEPPVEDPIPETPAA